MGENANLGHISVLLHPLVEHITIFSDRKNTVVDCTLGLGGHAMEIIKKMKKGDTFVGFDADNRNLELAKTRLQVHAGNNGVELILIQSNFVHCAEKLNEVGIDSITGIYFDLGLSSLHIDDGSRGFSIKHNGPLDMRFDTSQGKSASEIVNYYKEEDLVNIFSEYGEEPNARKIAKHIIQERKIKKLETTDDLVKLIDSILPYAGIKERIFQAIRIEVNAELKNEEIALQDGIKLLETGGRIFVISFHSLEDRIVKNIFRDEAKDCICSDIICTCKHTKSLKLITKKPILPTSEEIQANIRSRSAKARCAEKL